MVDKNLKADETVVPTPTPAPAPGPKDPTPVKDETKPKPASQVDTKTSAQDMLDPSRGESEAEAGAGPVTVQVPGGSSYPTAEALEREKKAREEARLKEEQEALKSGETRSAVEGHRSGVLTPDAADSVRKAQENLKKTQEKAHK